MSTSNTPTTPITTTQAPSADEMKIKATQVTSMEMSSMESRQLHSGQKEAMKKIPEFSGEENELDIDEWLFDLTNLFSLMKLNDETKILETMGKLSGPALRWYQQHLSFFTSWNETEEALKERFKQPTSDSQLMKEFFQLQQEENQSIASFYETVIRKYRKARKFITEHQVITVLQNGVKNSLKEYLIRKEKDIDSPEKWLELAREEDYIQKRIQQRQEEITQTKFETVLPTATINPQSAKTRYGQEQRRQHVKPTNYQSHYQQRKKIRQTNKCAICNRRNHSTNQCYYKKESGCFKCGQSNHQLRDCPTRHFFE